MDREELFALLHHNITDGIRLQSTPAGSEIPPKMLGTKSGNKGSRKAGKALGNRLITALAPHWIQRAELEVPGHGGIVQGGDFSHFALLLLFLTHSFPEAAGDTTRLDGPLV